MLIFHQSGHQSKWNKDSFQEGIGDGIILSPVHCNYEKVVQLEPELKAKCFFDPQFYVPDSQKWKLNSYPFFPEQIADGFSTRDFAAVAYDTAQQCVDFQIGNGFRGLIIPTRYYNEMITDYIPKQKAFSVEPFLSYIQKNGIETEVFLTLALTSAMINDEKYRIQLLNWITSYPEIAGVYLIVNFDEPLKQICDMKKISDYMDFIGELAEADLRVICGYCNTESLLCAMNDPFAVTLGAYENTRRFSIDKFLDDESDARGPAPRIYFPGLLNWVRYDTAMEIRVDLPELWNRIYTPTSWSEAVFKRGDKGTRPHFTQPYLYQHHFKLIHDQLRRIADQKGRDDKIALMQKWITEANGLYEEIQNNGVLFFDNNCKGVHLPGWNRVLRRLRQQ